MRALTVRQPWAWAIVHGGKDVENRSRNVAGSYRGPVAIHAAKIRDEDAWQDPAIQAATPSDQAGAWEAFRHRQVVGAFVGVVDLVGVHDAEPEIENDSGSGLWAAACCESPWRQYGPTRVHLVLANPRPLEVPIPARGMLGLWTPPADLLEQLQAVTR